MPQQDETPKKQRTATNPKTGEKFNFDPVNRKWVKQNAQQFGSNQQPTPPPQQKPEQTFPLQQVQGKPPVAGSNLEPDVLEQLEGAKEFGGEVKEAAPYVAGGAATALAPEASLPLYLSLAFGGAAAGQGALDLGKDISSGTPPKAGDIASNAALAGVTKGVVPEVAGRGINKAAGALYKKSPVPAWIEEYLAKRGVTLTGGEKAGAGAVSTAENVAGSVAINTGLVNKFMLGRQDAYDAMLNDMTTRIVDSISDTGPMEWSMVQKEGDAKSAQEVAQRALDQMSSARQMSNYKLGEAISGKSGMTPAEAGDTIIQAVRGTYDAADNSLDKLYEQLKPQIKSGNYQVPWNSAGPEARRIFERAEKSQKMGGSPLPPDLMASLKAVAGITDKESWGGQVKRTVETPMGAFDAAWGARRSFGRMIGKLESQGVISREDYGAYKRIYQMMTKDMLHALPSDLGTQFVKAAGATEAMKDKFNSDLLKSMLRTDRPVAAEKVFSEVMKSGNETGIRDLMRVIGDKPDAVQATRRSAVEWLFKNSVNDEQALNILEKRPGLKQLFGGQYDNLRAELAARVRDSLTPQAVLERKFLTKIAGLDDPDEIAARMLKSPLYANRMAELTKNDPMIHQDLAVRSFQQLVDKSTHNGPFGALGSQFDPVQFAQNWQRQRKSFERVLAPEVLHSIDELGEVMSRMTFLPNSGVAAKFKTLAEISAVTGGAMALVTGALSGNPKAAVEAGIVVPLAAVYGPQAFIRATLSPTGSKLLAEGLKIPIGRDPMLYGPQKNQQATAWAMRFLEYIAQTANADSGSRGGTAQRASSTPPPAVRMPPNPGQLRPMGAP